VNDEQAALNGFARHNLVARRLFLGHFFVVAG
jgi:hypothetical protein